MCLSLKSGRHIFLMKVVSFYPGMEIRKISIDQEQVEYPTQIDPQNPA